MSSVLKVGVKVEYFIDLFDLTLKLGERIKTEYLDADDMFPLFAGSNQLKISKKLYDIIAEVDAFLPPEARGLLGILGIISRQKTDEEFLQSVIVSSLKMLVDAGGTLRAVIDRKSEENLISLSLQNDYIGRETTMNYLGVSDIRLAS